MLQRLLWVRELPLHKPPLRLDTGAVDGFIAVSQDITQQKLEEVRLKDMAQRDPLTGLLNRLGFEQVLDAHPRAEISLAVLYIDLDHFKPVNDTYGHPVGDEVLRQFAQRLSRLVRPGDAVARLGGDEFAVAVFGLPRASLATALAEKVLVAATKPFDIGQLVVTIGASVGVAFSAAGTTSWRELVLRADGKLLVAKGAGRGRQCGETL